DAGLREQLSEFGRADAGFREQLSEFGRADAGLREQLSEFGRADAGFREQLSEFGRADAGFSEQLSSFGQVNAGFREQLSSFGRVDAGLREQLSELGLADAGFRKQLSSFDWANAGIIREQFSAFGWANAVKGRLVALGPMPHTGIGEQNNGRNENLQQEIEQLKDESIGSFVRFLDSCALKIEILQIIFEVLLFNTTSIETPEDLDEAVAFAYRKFLDCEELVNQLRRTPVHHVACTSSQQMRCWYRAKIVSKWLDRLEQTAQALYEQSLKGW
ncbi:MAG: hypothetical protein K2Z81_23720, partial [Cyanobacteria bacterium]|nr:hypothetical protein [Cyanobacteriota bacterium]